jgi:hypothetical protein
MITPFSQLNLGSVEHVWVEYHVAEPNRSVIFYSFHVRPFFMQNAYFEGSYDDYIGVDAFSHHLGALDIRLAIYRR